MEQLQWLLSVLLAAAVAAAFAWCGLWSLMRAMALLPVRRSFHRRVSAMQRMHIVRERATFIHDVSPRVQLQDDQLAPSWCTRAVEIPHGCQDGRAGNVTGPHGAPTSILDRLPFGRTVLVPPDASGRPPHMVGPLPAAYSGVGSERRRSRPASRRGGHYSPKHMRLQP